MWSRTLQNAVEQGKVHHAYLFVGSRGTGKTSMAKILAACLNCVNGPTVSPCGECESCRSIAGATSLDVIEMDAASNNSVDDIRDLREKVAYAPVSGRHKVYILDEAHMLSPQAWNAFLKTLEEPPPRTIFVLATTEAQKVLPTVVDRCHRFDFGRPAVEQVVEVLQRVARQERIDIDEGAVALIARHATGSFRDALGHARAAPHLRRRAPHPLRGRARGTRGGRRRAAVRLRRRRAGARPRRGPAGRRAPVGIRPRPGPGAARPRDPRPRAADRPGPGRGAARAPGHARARSAAGRAGGCADRHRRGAGCSTWSPRRSRRRPTAPRPGSSSSWCWSRRPPPSSIPRWPRCWRGSSGSRRAGPDCGGWRHRARPRHRPPSAWRKAQRRRRRRPRQSRRPNPRRCRQARSSSRARLPPGRRWWRWSAGRT